jgi:hypothetical protein
MKAGGAALGEDGRIESGSAIVVGMVEEPPQPGKLFFGSTSEERFARRLAFPAECASLPS